MALMMGLHSRLGGDCGNVRADGTPTHDSDACDGSCVYYKLPRASVAQLVRARDCQSLGRRFDSG